MTDDTRRRAEAQITMRGLRGKRIIAPTDDDLIDALADDMQFRARQSVARSGTFHIALSGGKTPLKLYRRLMIDPSFRAFPWDRTHLWIVDERCVPESDERNNFNNIRQLIVEHADIPRENVHPMPVLERNGPRKYEEELRSHLAMPNVDGRLDYILLGMGNDGHTASLFPETPGIDEDKKWVILNDGPTVVAPRPRMTMTYPIINAARTIVILVTGDAKHAMLQRIMLTPNDPRKLPITGVEPTKPDTEMTWYLDEAAALGPQG
jgi:hexose-6-phosphate dehydrogenase